MSLKIRRNQSQLFSIIIVAGEKGHSNRNSPVNIYRFVSAIYSHDLSVSLNKYQFKHSSEVFTWLSSASVFILQCTFIDCVCVADYPSFSYIFIGIVS